MGRSQLPLGTPGAVRLRKIDAGWRADCLFRDLDGHTRRIKRDARTKAEAESRLKEAIRDRAPVSGAGLSGGSKFAEAAALWLEEVGYRRKGTTYDTYRRNLNCRVLPAFGALTLRECDNVSLVHNYLRALERDAGLSPNMVRSCRSVVSGVLGLAAQRGAIRRNPVRDAGRVEGGRSTARALTASERVDFLTKLDSDERAIKDGLPELARYMLATGVRIGEAMGLRWCRIDLDAGVAVHGDNLVRVQGQGLVLQTSKTEAGFRALPLAPFVLDMLWLRYPGPEFGEDPVFGNKFGDWRDPNNTGRSLRKFCKRSGYEWVTSHVFRKTAITILDQAGLSARAIAGYVGHSRPSITMDSYMDKRPEDRAGALALDAAMRPAREVMERYGGSG